MPEDPTENRLGELGSLYKYYYYYYYYLLNRNQFVGINGHRFSLLNITHEVLQGSILDPFLFLIVKNELPSAILNFIVDIYADGTTFSSSAH